MKIPFNKPHLAGKELEYITDVASKLDFSGDGSYTKRVNEWLKNVASTNSALLTHSCTAAMEMMALLIDIEPGDEVIMPSFTFPSTANAFVLRGAKPVFVDIRSDTLNIDETQINNALTDKTRAIVPVHYAGVSCEMDQIMELARGNDLYVLEDAAQAYHSTYKDRALGSIGDLGAYSFHQTKNISAGEAGALLINRADFIEKSEIIYEKGTNRSNFLRGEVDKYTWVEKGSSYMPGEIIAAFLYSQLESAEIITKRRLKNWNYYHQALESLESEGVLRRPVIPDACEHNGHVYYILLNDAESRNSLLEHLKLMGIQTVWHFEPLHSSPAGKSFSRFVGNMSNTNRISETILRLPMYHELIEEEIDAVVTGVSQWAEIVK